MILLRRGYREHYELSHIQASAEKLTETILMSRGQRSQWLYYQISTRIWAHLSWTLTGINVNVVQYSVLSEI